jgi:hypothetical protein
MRTTEKIKRRSSAQLMIEADGDEENACFQKKQAKCKAIP